MRIIAHDPFISEQGGADLGVELVSLDDLFARADYVSLHMPANEKTRHLVNAERLSRAKKGIRLINTARGDLIDEQALADAIESGQVAAAALDVFQTEPPSDQRLQKLPPGGGHSAHRRLHARGRSSSAWKPPRRCAIF